MKAIGKHILVTPINEDIETKSGMFLSGDEKDKVRYKKGTIVQVGTLVSDVIKQGAIIHYDSVRGFEMVIEGENYAVISESDVIVVL